jgi:hypothetical protein
MAGDGGRAPDVSEQRATRPRDHEHCLRCGYMRSPTAPCKCGELATPRASDPASVLAALLAEQPDATIGALETLLTSDEAVDHTLDEMMQVFAHYGPNFARLNPTDMRLVALRLSRAPVRSLLSKAPKEDGDA